MLSPSPWTRRPVTGRTLYEIGSITKQFTAAAALELIKSGAIAAHSHARLALTTPLSAVFGNDPFWKAQPWLTVGRLLTMRSNLPNFTRRPPDGADPWQPISADVLFRDIEKEPPSVASDDFDYSNTNYFLLAELMEQSVLPGKAQPESYHALLRKRIFEPAGMDETRFIDDKPASFDPDASVWPAKPVSEALSDQTATWALPDYGRRRRPAFIHPDWLKGSADAVSSAREPGQSAQPARTNEDLVIGRPWHSVRAEALEMSIVPRPGVARRGPASHEAILAAESDHNWRGIAELPETIDGEVVRRAVDAIQLRNPTTIEQPRGHIGAELREHGNPSSGSRGNVEAARL